ncbi:MAG TPA: acetate--CoA ligase family protein, partial [Desulfohalobiaceae bacterium]|nr:acetate--CoA ligase family protein [Desulfohalobiaceae bacterium]
WMPIRNPIDLWPAMDRQGVEKVYEITMQALCSDPNVESIVLHICSDNQDPDFNISSLAQIANQAQKPVLCWLLGSRDKLLGYQKNALDSGLLVYRELFRTLECLNTLAIQQTVNKDRHFSLESYSRPRELPTESEKILSSSLDSGILDEFLSKKILKSYEIPCVQEQLVSTPKEAIKTAEEIGYPVVIKGLADNIVHKTEAGLVKTNLYNQEDVRQGLNTLALASDFRNICLIQKQITAELELILGGLQDPQFGPCVMLGLGGTMAEVFQESVFAIVPLSRTEALNLISRLPYSKLFQGFRGSPALRKDLLADIIVNLANLLCDCSQIEEIDINPLLISQGEPIVVDATIITNNQ